MKYPVLAHLRVGQTPRVKSSESQMPIDEETYAELRPFMYHLTDWQNVERLQRTRKLQRAATLLALAGKIDAVTNRRDKAFTATVETEAVILRDQAPLYENTIRLEGGWSFAEFVEHLNQHVFFWPGTETGPIDYGVRHFQRYSSEQPVIFRVRYLSTRAENPDAEPLFCKYN